MTQERNKGCSLDDNGNKTKDQHITPKKRGKTDENFRKEANFFVKLALHGTILKEVKKIRSPNNQVPRYPNLKSGLKPYKSR